MNIKIKLTKKQLLKLALFVAVIGIAHLIDSYLDKNPVHLNEAENSSNSQRLKELALDRGGVLGQEEDALGRVQTDHATSVGQGVDQVAQWES